MTRGLSTISRPRAVIFDWDNTLVDSWPVIQDALNTTFRTYGLPEWSLADCRQKVRKSMREAFPPIFGARWEEAGEVFYTRYAEIHAEAVVPADGAGDMLDSLLGAGIYLCVVSNKKGDFLRKEADNLGWTPYFGRLVGAFDAVRDKPDPAPVHMALAPGGISPGADVWFVGDADIDLECAVSAALTPVLLRPHAPAADEFTAFPPALHFPGCQGLCNFITSM